MAALITKATGVEPYFVGKPNPLMMRSALNPIDAHSETTVMIGDRMDTDVVAGLEAGHAHLPGAHRHHPARRRSSGSRSGPPGWSTRSPTWSTSSNGLNPSARGSTPTGTPAWTDRRGGDPPAETLPEWSRTDVVSGDDSAGSLPDVIAACLDGEEIPSELGRTVRATPREAMTPL